MTRQRSRLFGSIVAVGVALPVAALTLPAGCTGSEDDDGQPVPDAGDHRPDATFSYIWDAALPPDADVDAAPDGGEDAGSS